MDKMFQDQGTYRIHVTHICSINKTARLQEGNFALVIYIVQSQSISQRLCLWSLRIIRGGAAGC